MTDKLFILGTPIISILANASTDALTPDTHISIGVAVGVGSVIMTACWWLATKFKGVDDQLAAIEKHIKNLPCEGRGCHRKDE